MRPLRRLVTRLYTRFPWLVDRWLARHPIERPDDVPFTPWRGRLPQARVALVTTAGVHLAADAPFDLTDADGDASIRLLPAEAPPDAFRISHDSYDTTDALADLEVVAPLAALRALRDAGWIGSLVAQHVGLMGHIDGPHLPELVERSAPAVARSLAAQGADVVLLAPA